MSKISELSDGGSLQSTDYLIAVRSGGNVKVQPNGTVTGTTGSFSGNVTFADNAKAIFGAGSDLQIYHDGSNSRIDDTGTGNLILRGSSAVSIQKYTGETLGVFNADGSVLLAHDNVTKFETTATGIDVTGTVTADGLTVDTNTLHVDATNNRVGVGTTSPSDLLDISANGTSAMRLSDSSTPATYAQITQANGVLTFAADAGNAQTGSNMQFEVDGTESMRIDSSGNVGIGTTSPATNLEVSDATNPTIRITNSTAALGAADVGSLEFFTDDLSISAARVLASIVCVNRGTSPSIPDGELVFKTSVGGAGPLPATEKMRLDQNGNLLVGTTSAVIANSSSNVGTAIGAGLVESARAGVVAQLNRHTSDGSILDFQKDGTTVGSIGSAAGQDIVIGSGSAGLRFLSTGPAIQPRNADGTANNDAIDLGLSTNRFKDLYLSGGVYLGGTGAGNLLDDYETGTFTPTVYSSDNTTVLTSGVDYTLADYRYVKTGNHVMMEIRIRDLRVIKTDIWCTIPFTSLTSDAGVGITAEGDVMYLASNRLNLRKGTNQYPYGIVNFESS